MMPSIQKPKFFTHLVKCIRLLYWVYFKPRTFTRWLQKIDPQLKPTSNPFAKSDGTIINLPLQRYYAKQVLFISLFLPFLALLLVPPLYTTLTGDLFNWRMNGLFLINGAMLLWVGSLLGSIIAGVAFGIAFGLTFGLGFGIALATVAGVTFNLESGILFGALFGLVFGMACAPRFDIPNGVALALPVSMVSGIIGSVFITLEFGLAFALASSIMWIGAVLRLYFWVPELFWMGILTLITPATQRVKRLSYLPLWYDELIHLPLPFVTKWVTDAYQTDPIFVREKVEQLSNSTATQDQTHQALIGITLERLKECQTTNDLLKVRDELNWISALSVSTDSILDTFLELRQTLRSTDEPLLLPANDLQQADFSLSLWSDFSNVVRHTEYISALANNENIAQPFHSFGLEKVLYESDEKSAITNQDSSTCTLPPIPVISQGDLDNTSEKNNTSSSHLNVAQHMAFS